MKRNIALLSLGALVMFAFVSPVSAATINLNGGSSVALGQSDVVISGTCSGSTLNVPIVLDQGGKSTNVALATTPDNGPSNTFVGFANFPLNVDDGFTTGAATLTAVCPDANATVSIALVDPDPATINVPIGTSLNFNGSPSLGNSFGFNGVCGTNAAGSNVNFSITQNGSTSNLGSATTTGTGGDFAGNVNFGSGIVAGPATITATCPGTGNVITSAVNIVDPNATGGNGTGTGTGTGTSTDTGTSTGMGSTAGTGTVGTSTTPTGGVAAGSGLNATVLFALALMLVGLVGYISQSKKSESLN